MSRLKIFGNSFHDPSAGLYYRVRAPLRAMELEGIADVHLDDPWSDNSDRQNYLYFGDVSLHFLVGGKEMHKQFQVIRDLKPAPDATGFIKYPPVIVFDMDDDIEVISPLNPKFATLGTRDGDGNLLEPRSDFGIQVGENEAPVYLWKHDQMGLTGRFNAGENIIRHSLVRKVAQTAHAITCTGPELEETAKRWNPRTFVYPNSILFDDIVRFKIERPKDEVRVFWQGGYSHYPDFYPLKGAFSAAYKRMPHVKWVILGQLYKWVFEHIPAVRIEFYPWVRPGDNLQAYWLKYASMGPDINIAPLVDTRFNRCKSAIKFYEAAAYQIPTLAANCGPYREIIDGDTGFLYSSPEEFVDKLERLVKDADLRVKIGKRAEEWVREHRDARKNCHALYAFYEKLHKEVGDSKLRAA